MPAILKIRKSFESWMLENTFFSVYNIVKDNPTECGILRHVIGRLFF